MSYFRSHHVFVALMGAGAICAFLIPPQYSGRFEPRVDLLFAPVSAPVRMVAGWISDRVAPPPTDDLRRVRDISEENKQLRADVIKFRAQLEDMYRRDAELSKLGPKKDDCQLVKVISADGGTRESIGLEASTLSGLRQDMYVLSTDGLVGQIQGVGIGGARVRLITDQGFRVKVRFARYVTVKGQTTCEFLGTPIAVVEGAGEGTMVARRLTLAEIGFDSEGKPLIRSAADVLHVGDYALLYDPDCPRSLQGEVVGRVVRISRSPDARLFAEVHLKPNTRLTRLREVMVMVKEN
jgi:hypothetical protein